MIDGEQHYIGTYANEEDAAIDHARAIFKYNKRECRSLFLDLGPLPDPKEMEERHRRALAYSIMSDQDRER